MLLPEHYVDNIVLEQIPTEKLPREPNINPFVPGGENSKSKEGHDEDNNAKPLEAEGGSDTMDQDMEEVKVENTQAIDLKMDDGPSKKRRLLCARPFPNMRGHTAFLTFVHAGNKPYHDPREL